MTDQPSLHKRFIGLSSPMLPEETNEEPVLKELQGIRALVYDFYGTLFISGVGDIGIDDARPDTKTFSEALKSSGIQITDKQAGAEGFKIYNEVIEQKVNEMKSDGNPNPEPDIRIIWERVLDRMFKSNLIEIPQKSYPAEQVAVEFEARMNAIWPMPEAVETLAWFKNRNMLQGIISNSQFYTPVALEALAGKSIEQLGFDMRLLHWSYTEKIKKPGLAFYKSFLKKLHRVDPSIKPTEVLYIGNDMLKDVFPAVSTGFKTALFAGDKRSLKWRKDDPRCVNLEPDLVITSFSQLIKCIKL
ncbi:MAG: HAD family hydrolase [Balneolaceae bacterium]